MLKGVPLDPRVAALMSKRKPVKGGPSLNNSWDALSRLFNKNSLDNSIECARYWSPWEKPSPHLPIDNSIYALIHGGERKDHPRIIDREALRNIGYANGEFHEVECPYEYVRDRLGRAVGLAYDDVDADKLKRESFAGEITRIRSWSAQSINKLERLLKQINETGLELPPSSYAEKIGLSLRPETQKRSHELRAAITSLKEIEKSAISNKKKASKTGKPEEVWWVSFVIRCGIMWTTLTGSVPKKGHAAFEQFLRNANESLGGTRSDFDSQIDTALAYDAKMEPWNRLDAELKGVLYPGYQPTRKLSEDDVKARHIALWQAPIVAEIRRAQLGDEEAKLMLGARYAMASASGKARIDELIAEHSLRAH
jgi:hypothetical protein